MRLNNYYRANNLTVKIQRIHAKNPVRIAIPSINLVHLRHGDPPNFREKAKRTL